MAVISSEGIVNRVNTSMLTLLGKQRPEVEGLPYWELDCWVHSEAVQNRVLFAMEQSAINDEEVRMESQFKDVHGNLLDIDFHIKALFDEATGETIFLATGFNVTDLVKARRSLSEKERQMQALFDYSEEGFFMNVLPEGLSPVEVEGAIETKKAYEDRLIDDFITYQRISRYNKAFREILGCDENQPLPSDRMYELLQIHGQDYRRLMKKLIQFGEAKLEKKIIDCKGQTKIVQIYMVIIQQEGLYYGNFGVLRDMTTQRMYEEELEFYAFRDPLTHLENRRTFFNRASKFYASRDKSGAIIMMDIDHFKRVNDTYGHQTGDLVLRDFAQVLLALVKEDVLTARYGGEEFVLLLMETTKSDAIALCEQLLEQARQLTFFSEGGEPFSITISAGLTVIYPQDQMVDITISRADKALYDAKQSGRNRLVVL